MGYTSTLPATPPSHPDIDFHRGNFCRRVPEGMPPLYAGTTLILTWDLIQYAPNYQQMFLQAAAGDGATHIDVSIPQTKNAGKSLGDLVALAQLCKQYVSFVIVNCAGGDGENFDTDIKPWLDALVAAKAVDILCVAWQGDQHYSPMALCELTFQVSDYAKAHGLKVAQHWVNDACAWWNPADEPGTCQAFGICDRFSYQQKMTGIVDYHYFQCNTEAPITDIQEGLAKVLQSLTTQKLVFGEYDAQAEFDDPAHRLAPYGALKGYLGVCTSGFGKTISGYLNDGAHPDGSVL